MTPVNRNSELIEKLKNPAEADAYFEAVLKECKHYDDTKAKEHILEALKNISAAQPENANLDLSQDNFKLNVVLRVLNFVAKKLT